MNNKRKRGCGCGCFGFILIIVAIYIIIRIVGGGTSDKKIDQTEVLQDMTGTELNKVYDQLDDSQKAIYDALLVGVPTGNNAYKFPNANQETFAEAYTAFLYDHPEFFWLSTSYRCGQQNNEFVVMLKNFNYWDYTTNPQMYIDQLNQKISEIVAGGAQYTNVYDKVKYVHDYLIKNITYDFVAAEECNNTIRSTNTEQALSVYGALVNGRTICGGYSESFYLLMNAMGVECHYLQGDAGEYHAWNYLEIAGEYYYMDVTWDDINEKDANGQLLYPNGVLYNYFCITGDELLRTHTPDEGIWAPQTSATEYNYFRREGFYFETYDYANVVAALNKQKGQEAISVQFSSEKELNNAYKDLVENGKITQAGCFDNLHNVAVGRDAEMYVLTFYEHK